MPVVDVHTHLARIHFHPEGLPRDYTLTAEQLVNRMDREGIDVSVLLPLETPAFWEYYLTAEALADAARFRDYPFTPEQRESVMGGTAARLLKLV